LAMEKTTMATRDPLAARIGEALIDDRPISAGLAARLAEAAFGYMGLGPVYLVATYEPTDNAFDPYNVTPFKNDWEGAEALIAILNADPDLPEFGVFGPYETGLGPAPLSPYYLEAVSLLVGGPDGETGALAFGAGEYDSLFWTRAAVEKFAVPYYSALYSPVFAQSVLEEYETASLAVLGHMPWSEYTELTPPAMSSIGAFQQGPIPVLHHRDESGRWQRKPLYPGAVGKE
jgi:hypothetical protein